MKTAKQQSAAAACVEAEQAAEEAAKEVRVAEPRAVAAADAVIALHAGEGVEKTAKQQTAVAVKARALQAVAGVVSWTQALQKQAVESALLVPERAAARRCWHQSWRVGPDPCVCV